MARADLRYDDGVLTIAATSDPLGLSLAGEIDESTYPALIRALDELAARSDEIHIDLAAVRYCDLAGLRALVRMTVSNGSGQARHVVLHSLPAHLHNLLRILGWDELPGLSLRQGTAT